MLKKLDTFCKSLAPLFAKGGKLERWYPLYEATDSFLFGCSATTNDAPHVRDSIDLKRIMITVIVALIPCVFMALWNTGYQANMALESLGLTAPPGWRGEIMAIVGCNSASLLSNISHGALYFMPVYLVTLVVGSFWELLFNIVRKHEMSEAFLVTSLLFTLTLPPSIPLWQVAAGISFGVVFGKEVFGGVGLNFMNPALVSRAFIFFAYPAQMTGDNVWHAIDGITTATPIAQFGAAPAGEAIAHLNHTFSQMFLGSIPGSMGETSTLACLIGAIILLLTGIASWRIMLATLLGAIGCATLFYTLGGTTNPLHAIPPHYHLVMGGLAFGLVFMATDPVSAAQTNTGQWLYGLLIGSLAILIRVANPAFPEGVMLAILLGNTFAPLFDHFVLAANVKRRKLRHG